MRSIQTMRNCALTGNLQHMTVICSPQHMTSHGDAQLQSSTTFTCRPHSPQESFEPLTMAFFFLAGTGFWDFLFMARPPFLF
jgi:hypothetical protein